MKRNISVHNAFGISNESYIMLSTIFACSALYVVEQVLAVSYVLKTLAKLSLFVAIPLIYYQKTDQAKRQRQRTWRDYSASIALGLGAFAVIMAAFYLTRSYIDLSGIVSELQTKSKITPTNFLLVGAYITFGNSFLEEYFFRGFVFMSLRNQGKKKLAYVFSSLLFAVYHIAIFKTWFSPPLLLVALLGLVTIGFVFNWLTVRSGSYTGSWLTHVLADIAIILIGMRLFAML